MVKTRIWSLVSAALTAFVLSACGGGAEFGETTGGTLGGTTGGTTGGGGGDTGIRVGILSGEQFTPGAIAISQSPLDAGGSAGLRVDIVDTENGNALVTEAASVTFSSPCQAQGQAQIDTPVATSTGSASTTYRAQGCSGDDVITATVSVGGESLVATSTIEVLPSPASAISFISATPSVVGLRGSGRPDTAVVIFQVTNAAGGAVANQTVVFTLDTTVGGITLNPVQGVTDSNGFVQTTVNAGTVHTSVRITARLLDSPATPDVDESLVPPAQSESLVISTGLADQDSFSLSVGCFNIEGDTLDGNQTNVNILAADRFNNPVPDGTAVAFTVEGGSVQSECLTVGGGCSVQFTTQNPRRPNHRVTLLATAIGEESFTDINGDGRYDAGEPFLDEGEAFRDDNENGVRDGNEPFLDFNDNGVYDGPSGSFTGVLCDSGCDSRSSLHARDQQVIIMSGSTAFFDFTPNPIDLSNGAVAVRVDIGDDAGQPMPGASRIEASTTLGSIIGDSSFDQVCTTLNAPFPYTFVIEPPTNDEPDSGIFSVKVTTPSGVVSSAAIGVTFSPDPGEPPPPPGDLGSIKFVSASPETIGIRGTGLDETADVTFQVFSDTGAPIANQPVTFSLSTSVGGIELQPTTAVSDASGVVRTIVRAGTVHTAVRVRATATGADGSPTVSALSSQLTITTGLPDQNSVSLSVETLNPQAWDVDGTTVPVTVRAADRFNNPVPDGTAFAFTTSGGSIGGSCVTVDGACTVNWVSQNPRVPRAVILTTAVGEESFIDSNGNGRYDDGEPFQNLAEAFRDDNLNGAFDSGVEEFLDFNGDNRRNDPNDATGPDFENPSRFTGTLCNGPNRCDEAGTLHVFDSIVITMSDSESLIDVTPPSNDITVDGGSFELEGSVPTITIPTREGTGGTATLRVVIRDLNDQPMPLGTVISLTNFGGDVTITPSDAYVVGNQTDDSVGGNTYTWTIVDEVFVPGDQLGALTLEVTAPNGAESSYEFRLRLDDQTGDGGGGGP
ncbi:hypothetical protein C8D93_105229 [Sinimarinibacterium flocculans]|uniref:Ig-like protein group 1 n=1 Tax=Sinimarinibacterium flocculans TaxID=985250 RepID=A0A318ECZ4_9GAMM|nr:hypothetical protein C8D93_105229 [Sinimarinibacterium flocculans]